MCSKYANHSRLSNQHDWTYKVTHHGVGIMVMSDVFISLMLHMIMYDVSR
jgi:hypothetical protein